MLTKCSKQTDDLKKNMHGLMITNSQCLPIQTPSTQSKTQIGHVSQFYDLRLLGTNCNNVAITNFLKFLYFWKPVNIRM